jgi:hypothetical protein
MADSLLSSHNKTKSKSSSPTSRAISIMKSIMCPKGTRRLNGECVKIEDYSLQKSMIPRKDCPKGTRKSNVTGKCIKDEEYLVEQSQRLRKQCQSGTRRNSKSDCVPFTPVEKPVTLLGKNDLFQVSFNKSRLKTYEPVITVPSLEGAQQPGSITLLNSLVALGVLDSDNAKESLADAKSHVIDPLELIPYVFEMDRENIAQYGCNHILLNRDLARLQLNHATILHIQCSNNKDFPTFSEWDHYIIAFKHKVNRKTVITYYDPQSKRYMSSLEELFPENPLLSDYLDEKGIDWRKDPVKANQIPKKYLFGISSCMFYEVSSSENRTLKRIDKIPVKRDSPRTGYFNEHFSEPVKLLGGKDLVQFSVTSEQFEEYTNFTYAGFETGNCVLHSLFSLGLRNSTQVKRDSMRMYDRKSTDQGINSKKTARYLTNITGLPKGSIIVVAVRHVSHSKTSGNSSHSRLYDTMNYYSAIPLSKKNFNKHMDIIDDLTNKKFDRMIDSYLNERLVNNHATIIDVCFKQQTENDKVGCHSIVAYKRNDKIEFFDPQTDKRNAGRSTVKDCMDTYGKLLFTDFRVYTHSTPLKEDILIDDDRSCRIPFGNSPNDSPNSPLYLRWHAEANIIPS